MEESAHSLERTATRRRRTLATVAAIVAVVLIVVWVALPAVLRSSATSMMRDAIREELPGAEVEVVVSLGWTTPLAAVVEVSEGQAVRTRIGASTSRGLLRWIGAALGGSVGEVPIAFEIEGRFEGAAGRTFLERIARGGSVADGNREAVPEGESGGDLPSGLSIAASGSIELEFVDREAGLDVAIASDAAALSLSADGSLDGAFDLRIDRVADVEATTGRMRLEGSVADAISSDGGLDLAAASGHIAVDATTLRFEWQRELVAIDSLAMSASADPDAGLALDIDASGSFGGRGAVVAAGLRWRRPFDADGVLRSDFTGLGATGRLSGVPLVPLTSTLPTDLAAIVADLGTSLEAEWSLPVEGDDLSFFAATDRATLAASAQVDREAGRLGDGSVRFEAAVTRPSTEGDDDAPPMPVPIRLIASGIEYRDGELEVASAELVADRAAESLIAALDVAAAIEVLADASIEARADAIRWRVAGGLHAMEARGRIESDAVVRCRVSDDGPMGTVSRIRVEWFAEPLGRALSMRGEIGIDDGTLRFDERLDGLWTGRGWMPAISLRPHGTAAIDRLDPALLTPLLPDAMRAAWMRQSEELVEVQLSSRVEGDRLEGILRVGGAAIDLKMPLSIDDQRIAVGPSEASFILRREALAALPADWTGGIEIGSDLAATLASDPLLLPIEVLSGRGLETTPPFAATLSIGDVPIATAPGVAADASLGVRDLSIRVARARDGAASIDAEASLVTDVAGPGPERLAEVSLEAEVSYPSGLPDARLEVSALDASRLLQRLAATRGTVLEDPRARDWLGLLDLVVESGNDGGLEISTIGEAIEANATISRDAAERSVLERFDLIATIPPEAAKSLAGEAMGSVRPDGAMRLRAEGEGIELGEGVPTRGGLVLGIEPIDLSYEDASPRRFRLAGHRLSLAFEGADRGVALRLGPIRGEQQGTTIGFEGRLLRGGTPDRWSLDGSGSVQAAPTEILDGLLDGDELLAEVLGSPFEATFAGASLGTTRGELSLEAAFPQGTLRLPRLVVEEGVLRVPAGSPFVGELVFGDGLAALLEDLSPMLGSIDSLEAPVRLEIAEATIPRARGDRRGLSGDVRFEVGRGRFQPRGVLRQVLAALDDANAEGFAGEATPLVARVREGRLEYRDFEVRFVPYRDGWRNTIASRGSIDLASQPATGRFTMAFPATSLAAYSSEIRRILETRPALLESVAVPLTVQGPLDGSAPMDVSVEFDPRTLIETGVEALIDEGFRRLLDGLK